MLTELLADRYAYTQLLGRGGMGEVWEAWDTALERSVAVKLLTAAPGDETAIARFVDEARAVARLNDPHIAALYESGRAQDGRPFLVMELVRGRGLNHMLHEGGPLHWQTVADLGGQAALALTAAHAAGVVHRDIKPANLLVTDDGRLKVVDFGIATTVGNASSPSHGEPVLGTAAYTSPEGALGHPTGPASDLYALGCVLFEALTGSPPFFADTAAGVLYQHVHAEPPRIDRRYPGSHPKLCDLVHALLAKDAADRPGSARVVARHLAALLPAPQIPGADATEGLPSVPADPAGHTAPLPPVPEATDAPDLRSTRRGDRKDNRRRLFLIGGVAALSALVGLPLALASLSDGDSVHETGAAPTTTSAPATTDEPVPSSTRTAAVSKKRTPATASPSSSAPRVKQGTTPPSRNPQALAANLNSAFADASGTMPADLAREIRKEISEINKKIQNGETGKAAEKARDVRHRLDDAQQKGKWRGDPTLTGALGQTSAS
ncbi:protein kinase [Streptomyces sp. SCA3-4]|uniref:serine/threonine-protein kinase n=1 Tax=Streptomyces sichuanensis TaxID=2871810 RepID=UPI001CE23681|nr:serine/threonine-protein kinase [Streptomyces sichuanensis]MCA6091879.1 protein kinase [Streptomyces sichuanensis]